MSSSLKNNAYHILGLDTSASEKNILKRTKEIINRLKSEDYPNYDLDIGLFDDFRTEDTVRDALQRLQAPRKRIKEYFFWFQIADSIDEQVLGLFKLKDYLNAIRTWQSVSEGQSTKALFYKKNLAILYCLTLSTEDNKDYLRSSLLAWKELVESDKFWTSFSKVYALHDEQTASSDIILEFKSHVVKYLSDIYTDLHHIHKNKDYINEFQAVFSIKGEKIEKSVLGPAFDAINKAVDGLERMEVSKDGVFDKDESETIKLHTATVLRELNSLIDLGLYEDGQTKIMRDRAANALRSIVIDLHNNLSELDKSQGLLEAAIKIAGTESLRNKLRGELEQIKKSITDDTENSFVIEIPKVAKGSMFSFKNIRPVLVVKNTFFEFEGKRMYFKDVVSVSYDSTATSQSVYGVKVSTTYAYRWSVVSDQENISISLTASKDQSEAQEAWAKLIGLSSNFLEPLIVNKYVDQIFKKGETIRFGEIDFSKEGYSIMKFKFFSKNERIVVSWTDTIYIPKLHQGSVILWQEKNGESKQFATVPMSSPNAVVLPALVQACYDNREKNT